MTKEIKVNTVLFTKDGRKCGNAIIAKVDSYYRIAITDYGTKMTLTDNEINELFYIGEIAREDHKNYVEATK